MSFSEIFPDFEMVATLSPKFNKAVAEAKEHHAKNNQNNLWDSTLFCPPPPLSSRNTTASTCRQCPSAIIQNLLRNFNVDF